MLDANERSVYQLIELYSETDNGEAHGILFSKKAQPLYLEQDINWQSRVENSKTVCALYV